MQIIFGRNRINVNREKIHKLTGLPNAGKSIFKLERIEEDSLTYLAWRARYGKYYIGATELLYVDCTTCTGENDERSQTPLSFWTKENLKRREELEIKIGGFGMGGIREQYDDDTNYDSDIKLNTPEDQGLKSEEMFNVCKLTPIEVIRATGSRRADEARSEAEVKRVDEYSHAEQVRRAEENDILSVVPDKVNIDLATKRNNHDCGVFVMRHMEMFMGTQDRHWDCGFPTDKKNLTRIIAILRKKYACKMVTSEANVHREKVIREAKDLDMERKK
ncbi:hypothetical protein L1987_52635 [Smallanthus sonchifolius]|uniref:Uncharacterized protein n=1 Tax=Smallanthus sonchifolius TaxID=185202 RepID=A0ACB9ETS4_9ASTR|nr:hypothetical protein L1987_52635 [Smallanthus sonchifolius]